MQDKSNVLMDLAGKLSDRDVWRLRDVPEGIDEAALRALDLAGLVEVCRCDLPPLHKCASWFSPATIDCDDGRWGALLRACGTSEIRIRLTERARGELAALNVQGTPEPRASGMGEEEANVRVREYLADHHEAGSREIAQAIGCSTGLVCKTASWRAVAQKRRELRGHSKPAFVAMTDATLARAGEADRERRLAALVDEQGADHEPSPLEPDPDGDDGCYRGRNVRCRPEA